MSWERSRTRPRLGRDSKRVRASWFSQTSRASRAPWLICPRSRSPRSSTSSTRGATRLVAGYGGHVVKFSGDNCLAVFEPSDARDAVACVLAMRDSVRSMGEDLHLALDLGANVHIATVVSGRFGGPSTPSDDVIGAGVIHTYRMGSGAGIRISEPVYRKLPSAERGSWRKYQPPATYTLET